MSTEPPSASSRPAISSSAITSFLTLLPHSFLLSSPNTYLPTRFPLAFPTPPHSLNLLTTLHLVHATLSDPSHSTYFAETRSCPADTALRGILGLYLASDARWGRENLLSATAWRGGLLDDEKVGEFFGIEVMREREHEALRGVKVGERWSEGVGVVQSLVGLFREVGERLTGDCVGDAVRRATEQAGEGVGSVHEFARVFSQDVSRLFPTLASETRADQIQGCRTPSPPSRPCFTA